MSEIDTLKICAARLKEALNDNSLKAVELVEKTGIPKGTISHYATGRRVPSRNSAAALAKVLGVNPAWLMGFDVPKYLETPEREKQLLLSYYAQLSPEKQESVLNLIKTMI